MKIIDLSHTMKSRMRAYPGDDDPIFQKSATLEKDDLQITRLDISTHTGTHLDTPRHFLAHGSTTDIMELETFTGTGLLIVCSNFGKHQQIPLSHVLTYKKELETANFALIYTGWYRHWRTDQYFDHFPVLSVEASEFLISTKLKGIGLDLPSIDSIDSKDFPNHHLVLGSGLSIIENLTNLGELQNTKFQFTAFPLKIDEGDGSPVRAVAMIEPNKNE